MALLLGDRELTGCLLRELLWACSLAALELRVAMLALDQGDRVARHFSVEMVHVL